MRILALIPARGGSKRLPGKNIRLLGRKPLIVWSIDVAKDMPNICDILVSTDNPSIKAISTDAGALVPWLRPADLATDEASSVDVALHALDWYEAEFGAVDGLLLLQPTSPFRTRETVHKGIEMFSKNTQRAVIGVSQSHAHPMWTFKLDGDQLLPYLENHGAGLRSQDLPEAYVVNGCFYLISPNVLRAKKTFLDETARPLIIDSFKEEIDIDTEKDWERAESILNSDESLRDTKQTNNGFREDMCMSASTQSYLSENEIAFSLQRQILVHTGKPREVEIATLGGIIKRKAGNGIKGPLNYIRELIHGWDELSKLSAIKGSKKGKRAIVIGNGPSQGFVSAGALEKFSEAGNDVFAVNFWNQNATLSKIPPKYLVISDPATLANSEENGSQRESVVKGNKSLMEYLLEHEGIIIVAPMHRVKYLKNIFSESRVLGFFDTEMRWVSSNIDPRFPRGYVSMTLYKALALAIHMGYKQVYLVGMDNTYPRDIFCDYENKILNYARFAGIGDYLVDQTALVPSMDVWAQDIFNLFYDLRRCFSGTQVLNLDCNSLTDVFPKISNLNQIEGLLYGADLEN